MKNSGCRRVVGDAASQWQKGLDFGRERSVCLATRLEQCRSGYRRGSEDLEYGNNVTTTAADRPQFRIKVTVAENT